MGFDITAVTRGRVAALTLAGELDASAARRFQRELEIAAAGAPERLVLYLRDLTYMASAGIRMLIFAKQRMGPGVEVYVVAATEQVLDTLRRTGVYAGVVVRDEYPLEGDNVTLSGRAP
jgi:anti-anti-sigma factor